MQQWNGEAPFALGLLSFISLKYGTLLFCSRAGRDRPGWLRILYIYTFGYLFCRSGLQYMPSLHGNSKVILRFHTQELRCATLTLRIYVQKRFLVFSCLIVANISKFSCYSHCNIHIVGRTPPLCRPVWSLNMDSPTDSLG